MAMQSGFIKRVRDIMRMDAGINGDAQRIEQMVWMLFLKVYDAKEDDWELNEDDYESIIPEDLRWRNWAKADGSGHAITGDKLLNFVNNILFPVLKGNDVKDGERTLYHGIQVTPATPIKKAIVKSTFEDANNYMKDGVYLRQVIDIIDEIEFDDVKESHAFGFVYEEILRELQSAGSSGEFYTPRAVTEFIAKMIKPRLGEKMADFACGTGEELYQQIQAEKQKLLKEGKIKKEKPLPEITEDEKPFEIPESWKWVRVGNIAVLNPKNAADDEIEASFIPMTLISDGYKNSYSFEIRKWGDIKKGFTHFTNGDIGIAKITPCFQNRKSVILKSLVNNLGAGTTELSIVHVLTDTVCREYLLWFFKSDYFIRNGVKSFTGTAGQQRIHKDYLKNCAVPLPPLAEQKRIVAKLEELLPLCDRLK